MMLVDSSASAVQADRAARYQRAILADVSRTFALTIPQLPPALRDVVANAYLLCRIADTIEDDSALSTAAKERLHARFVRVVEGVEAPEAFAAQAAPRLARESASPAERDLVSKTPLVIAMNRRFSARQRNAMFRCVRVMCEGMPRFQRRASLAGLCDVAELHEYCDVVAGVVGEMLTELFCEYAPAIEPRRDTMIALGVSFGRGLQLTNILKDFWEDRDRRVCWLPRDVFDEAGIDLGALDRVDVPAHFHDAYLVLVSLAHGHLRDALEFTLGIPAHETELRRFCLIALVLAMRTLRRIVRRPDFRSAADVKVSRQVVASTVLLAHAFAGDDSALRRWFARLAAGLPAPDADALSTRGAGTARII